MARPHARSAGGILSEGQKTKSLLRGFRDTEPGGDKPLTIRSLDVGGDKPLAAYPMPSEDNPFSLKYS